MMKLTGKEANDEKNNKFSCHIEENLNSKYFIVFVFYYTDVSFRIDKLTKKKPLATCDCVIHLSGFHNSIWLMIQNSMIMI